jgi:Zn-dependent peptidase ImmA (M78 family)/DNA-binding XRE family transcriptional regulator
MKVVEQPTLNPARLELARVRNGLSKTELARRLGMTSRSVRNWETGEVVPPPETVAALAEQLEVSAGYLYRSDLPPELPEVVNFRSLTRLPASRRDAAKVAARFGVALATWIDVNFTLPEADVPDLTGVDPVSAAAAVRSSWAFGSGPAPNLVHVLEAHGVRVFSLAEDCAQLDAFSFWAGSTPFVFLNSMKTAERSRRDAAHELGHLVLHARVTPDPVDREREAEEFATALLLPEEGFLRTNHTSMGLNDFIELKRAWGVALTSYIRRLWELKEVSDWGYRNLMIEASTQGYRSREDEIPRERSAVLEQVLAGNRTHGVTLASIADELGCREDDIRALFFGLAMTSVTADQSGPVETSPPARPALRLVR